jgi:hypothetical protein
MLLYLELSEEWAAERGMLWDRRELAKLFSLSS